MERYIKNIPTEKRKKLKANIEKLRDNHKAQAELLSELYCLPNKILVAKADEVLKNRCSVESFLHTLEQTRKRMNEVMRLSPKDDKKKEIYTMGNFEADIYYFERCSNKEEKENFILNILKKIPSAEMDALILEKKI